MLLISSLEVTVEPSIAQDDNVMMVRELMQNYK